ncbi:flavin reductase family protein [Eubacterium oxidoreducens]|uniref:NADH-FMN oxidoreductase RutF, flavin reductase (DIM6/NTAB) family n=1 Tax=Eubacterium oxidoreducens TaxID=1732 RepID=A0A1G6BQP8_EUBOX|nr:flavin reductase [Eubacterium oxidoreducens]SDB22885.1 NADH-FMN oxidoreductase RutF, flavin reductase (DIM6/NTAB) family [Eubacterium oxidoreducens]
MHNFQPFDATTLDINPFRIFEKDWGVLTAMAGGKVNAMTVSWGGMGVIWGKKVATIYVRESRYTKELIDKSDVFSITFFDEKYRSMLKYLGAASGRDENKIKTAGMKVNLHKEIPFIDEGNFAIVCKKMAAVPMPKETFTDASIDEQFYADGDYHTMYIGEIVEFLAR